MTAFKAIVENEYASFCYTKKNSFVTGDLLKKVNERCVQLAIAAVRGLDNFGGLWYEKDK